MSISFQNVTNSSGISYEGESYGAYWGDYNKDSFPDVWLTNHQTTGRLYRNNGNGTFTDVSSQVFEDVPTQDIHGAGWADFDNDGDLDLVQQRSSDFGNGLNQFYVNEEGILVEKAEEVGIAIPNRGAYPLWLDFDRDGLLDLNVNGAPREEAPPTIFRQTEDNVFESANSLTGFNLEATTFGIISDVTGDDIPELIIGGRNFFDTSSLPFNNITKEINGDLVDNNAESAITADFNNDLLPDLFVTRKGDQSDIFQDSPNSLRAFFRGSRDEKGIRFTTTADVTFELATKPEFADIEDIKIGAGGFSPSDVKFTLSPDDPNVQGIAPHQPGVDLGVYVGYDAQSQEWQVLWSRPDRRQAYFFVEAEETISQVNAVGFDIEDQFIKDQLLINSPSGFVDRTQQAGISNIDTAGQSVAAADFDNDMDVDIYVVTTGYAGNRANFLYENQGDGTFVVVPDAGGAEGTSLGLGDSVTVADYDRDGFQDVFLTNGNFFAGLGRVNREFYNDGPYQLFRNQGNNNNWIEIELEGVLSNKDAIGAKVFATAGNVTQLREQNGKMHKSQSDKTIHFGLAQNNVVDLEIRWINGVVQKLENIAANQIIDVVEGAGADGNDSIDGSDGNDSLSGFRGVDILNGQGGNDTLNGGNENDTLFGGNGRDKLFGNNDNDVLNGQNDNDTLFGGQGNDLLNGGAGNDVIRGQENNDILEGDTGRDRLFGNGGNDSLFGGSDNDRLFGDVGDDLLIGDEGDDVLRGEEDNDTLEGSAGNDTVIGGAGNDLIVGGSGSDVLSGRSGTDSFRFLSPNDGVDEITDFSSGNDSIEIVASGFAGGLNLGTLSANQFVLGTQAQDSGDRFIYNSATGSLAYDADGTGSSNSVTIAILSNQASISATNISIV